jgi:hypothetical protein
MSRIVVLDYNVIQNLNRGSAKTATALKRLIESGARVYMAHQAYQEATSQPGKMLGGAGPDLPRTAAGNERLIADLAIRVTSERFDQRVIDRNNAGKSMSDSDALVLAQAKQLKADLGAQTVELWSFDKTFRNDAGSTEAIYGVKVAAESQTAYETPADRSDYQVARRLMGLKTDFEISVGGRIQRKPSKKPPGSGGGAGGSAPGGSDIGTPHADPGGVGEASARAQKIGDAFELGLKAMNFIIQSINDSIQADRMKKEWAKAKPRIQQKLQENPSLGVLIIVRFGRREKEGAQHETPLEHTALFLSIDTEYALTEDEAWDAYRNVPRQRDEAGLTITHKKTFIEPTKAVDVRKVQTPFTPYAIGTFVTGRARLMRVEWKGIFGFDEIGDVKLDVPTGMTPRFLLLVAPNEIEFLNGRIRHPTRVPVEWQDAASAAIHYTRPISVVDMDRGVLNLGHDTAAMIFPADNATARLFDGVGRMRDNKGQLTFTNIGMLRWARPGNIHVLQKFMEDTDVKVSTQKPVRFAPKEPPLRR